MSAAAEDALIGRTVGGRYRIARRIGSGGMGSVYAAVHLPSGETRALKALPRVGTAEEIQRRFEREAKAASLLSHPNIVEVLDFIANEADAAFLVMELVEGVSLSDRLDQGALPAGAALAIAREVLLALEEAHAAGIVHRDLKPGNVMLVGGAEDRIKLIDFGIVKLLGDAAADIGADKLTRTGVVFGTPEYLSPEQALGRPVDARADLYALGVILFEMLTGARPFDDTDPMALLRMHCTAAPPRLADAAPDRKFGAETEALVARALAKKPDDRFPSARAMREEVAAAADWLELGGT
jgi:serine/threonine protein kinase